MIWYALFIPIILSFLGWFLYKNRVTYWELLLAPTISAILIVVSYYTMKTSTLADVEYNGHLIVKAVYYEPFTTWVKKTCSYTTTTRVGKSTITRTHYYDCSYCDEVPARYVMYDRGGSGVDISESKYLKLKEQWSATPIFQELNRDIRQRGSCGVDGDSYVIKWDKKVISSETYTSTKDFSNILKCNHSAFNYPEIKPEDAKKWGLYDYPEFGFYNYQSSVLGINDHKLTKYLDYLNGEYGARYKVRVYTLFFKEKDISISFLQEAFWDGGNQNEIVVCIGLDKLGKITWVRPFSWCDNKLVLVDIKNDLLESKRLNKEVFYLTYLKAIKKSWHYKSFKDFNYLSFEPTGGQLWFVYVLTTLVSIGIMCWNITNEENNDED
jgi:hypothetical protein